MTRVILFDKDGTLLDYHKLWGPYAIESIQAFIETFRLHERRNEIANRLGIENGRVKGNSVLASGTGDAIHKAFQEFHEDAPKWMKSYYEQRLPTLDEHMEMIPGALETLQTLSTMGYKCVIVTSDSRQSTKMFVKKFGLERYVVDLVCGDDNPYHKPNLAFLEGLMNRQNLKLEDIVMVGDNKADTMLGFNEGVYTVGVLSGTGKKEDLEGANMIVSDVSALVQNGGLYLE